MVPISHTPLRGVALAAAFLLLSAWAAHAANPQLNTVLPRGAQRGADAEITFHGDRLEDAVDVFFYEPGITLKSLTAESANAVKATVTIDGACRLGPQMIRLRTRTGISNGILFSVGALPELAEAEPNSQPEQAQAIEPGHTINGVVESEDVDYYAVNLPVGGRLTVEIEGLRLGGMLYVGMPFDPKVRLYGPQGHERVAVDDNPAMLQDSAFVYTATEEGVHRIAVSDASYGGAGHAYYRLHVGTFPRPMIASPLGGSAAAEVAVNWLGDPAAAVAPGMLPPVTPLLVPAIQGIDPATIVFPKGETPLTLAVTEQGVAPTPLKVRRVELPVTMETEPNALDAPNIGPAPGAFEGVLAADGDEDFFAFEGAPHGAYDIRVWARELGSPLDSVLDVWNPAMGHVGGNDDTFGVDARMRVTVDADGRYTFRVRDQLGAGGDVYAYRVEVNPVEPAMKMSVLDNRPGHLTLHQGACGFLLVSAARDDFDAPVRLWLDGVPAGVTPQFEPIPAGATSTPIFFTCAPDAAPAQSPLRILGLGELNGQFIAGDLYQEIRLVEGNNQTTFFGHYVNRIPVAVAEAAPFTVQIAPIKAPFVHGTGRNIKVEITRNEGFAEAVAVSFPWLPAGIKGGTATIPGDQNSVDVYLESQPAAGEQVHNIFVQAVAGGYTICSAMTPVDVQPQWFNLKVPQVETDQGKPVEMVVEVAHVKPFEGEFDVHLLALPNGVKAAPQKVNKDTKELRFPLEVAPETAVGKHPSVYGETQVTVNGENVRHASGGGQLTVYAPLPAELAVTPAPAEEKPADAPERKTRFSQL